MDFKTQLIKALEQHDHPGAKSLMSVAKDSTIYELNLIRSMLSPSEDQEVLIDTAFQPLIFVEEYSKDSWHFYNVVDSDEIFIMEAAVADGIFKPLNTGFFTEQGLMIATSSNLGNEEQMERYAKATADDLGNILALVSAMLKDKRFTNTD